MIDIGSISKTDPSVRIYRAGLKTALTFAALMFCFQLSAASGSWSAGGSALFPSGSFNGLESRTDGNGSHVSPWIAIVTNSNIVSVSPTPTSPTSFVTYGALPISPGAMQNVICSASGKPVAYAITTPSITHQVYYYDSASSSFKLSFIPTPGNLAVNLNNTQQGSYVGAMTADIRGNIVLEIVSYVWRSTDDGKTFTYLTDTANFIQPPLPNNNTFGNVNTGLSYGTNAPNIQGIAGAPYGASVAPWGEMYIGKEFYHWRSYDDGQTWEIIDPLWYQTVRDTATGLTAYPNSCMSFAMFGKGDGAGFTTDGDVMLNSFRVASYVNSSFPKFFRVLPSGQIIHATNGDLDPVTSTYITNGYTLSQGSGVGLVSTKSGDTFGSIVWNTLPPGNSLNRRQSEIVKWDCDTKLWTIISPPAGGQPAAIASYTFARAASDGDNYFANSGPIYQWTPALGTNLRPDVTLKQVASNFPLTVIQDPNTHIASIIPGSSFNVSDDNTPSGNLVYSWSYRGQGRVTFDDVTNINTTAYFSNPGYYVLTLTANDGSLSGAMSVMVKVLPSTGNGSAPAISIAGQPVNQTLTVGQPITIGLTATGTNLKYQWKRNGMDIVDTIPGSTSYVLQGQPLDYSGTTTHQLTIIAGRAVDDGAIYYCEVTNDYGRVISNSATVGNAPTIIQDPVNNSTTNGDLSVSASGTQPFQWQWYSGTPGSGSKIVGANSSIYHATAAGTYYVVVSNIFGSATSASAQIGAFAGNSVTLNLSGVLNNGTLGPTASATFLAGSTIGLGADSETGWYYFSKWNSGSSHVAIAPGFVTTPQSKFSIDATASGTISLTTSGSFFTNEYVLTVKNGFGTASTHQHRFHAGDTVCMQAYPGPNGRPFNGWVVTKGGTLTGGFVANPGGGSSLTKFTFPSGDVELVATYSAGPAYTISGAITNSGNALSGASVVLSSGGNMLQTVQSDVNGMYTFNPIPDSTPYIITPGKTGFTFSPANTSGTLSGTNVTANFVAIAILPPTITSVTVNPNPVTGSTATAQATASDPNTPALALTYIWTALGPAGVTFSPNNSASSSTIATFSAAGSYMITVTVSNGVASNQASTAVTVNQTLTTIVVSPSAANVVVNGTQAFTATGTDQFGKAMTLQPAIAWSIASGIGIVSSTGLFTAPASPGSATINAASGAIHGTATITVTLKDTMPPVIHVPSDIVLPAANSGGSVVTFSVTATDNVDPNVAVTVVPPSGSQFPIGTTVISCSASDAAGNVSMKTFTVTVLLSFASPALASPAIANVGDLVQFGVAPINPNATITWDFGDGSTGSGNSVYHIFNAVATYTVTASATYAGTTAQSTVSVPISSIGSGLAAGTVKLTKLAVLLNFADPLSAQDTIAVQGTLGIPKGFSPSGKRLVVSIGGVLREIDLGSNGSGQSGADAFALTLKQKSGVVTAQNARFTLTLSGNFKTELEKAGFTNATNAKPIIVPIEADFSLDGSFYKTTRAEKYRSVFNGIGSAK